MSDDELIRDYARTRSSPAFGALVERHLNLVYSVARRQVRSDALAQEVTQAVFVDLAREAARWKPKTPVVAWLHLVARRTAIDVVRREARRHTREQLAAQLADDMHTPEPAWTEVEPLLDEAVEALAPPDRTAILLRFFENKSLREVGAALGTSDDAAQKRVSRALGELRAFFVRRGVAISAAGLAATLTTHAIISAPAALGAAVTSAGAAFSTTAVEVTRTVAMTTLQKSLVAASFLLVAGVGLHEAVALSRQSTELTALRDHTGDLAAQLQRARAQHGVTASQLKDVEQQIDARLPAASTPAELAMEKEARGWMQNLDQLLRLVDQRPEFRLPERAILEDEIWFGVAMRSQLETEAGIRTAFGELRRLCESRIVSKLQRALASYVDRNHGVLPARIEELVPLFDPPLDPALVARFEMQRSGKLADIPPNQQIELIGTKTVIDVENDSAWQIGLSGGTTTTAMVKNIDDAQRAYMQAHGGQRATLAAELAPLLRWPMDPVVLQKQLTSRNSLTP